MAEIDAEIGILRGGPAVANQEIDVALGVHYRGAAGLPDTAAVAVRGGAKCAGLLQATFAISHDPAVIRVKVLLRTPGDNDQIVGQRQAGALQFHFRIEVDLAIHAAHAGTGEGRGDLNGFNQSARPDINGVQPINESVLFDGSGHNEDGVFSHVDNRSAHDADRTVDVSIRRPGNLLPCRRHGIGWVGKVQRPQRRRIGSSI